MGDYENNDGTGGHAAFEDKYIKDSAHGLKHNSM